MPRTTVAALAVLGSLLLSGRVAPVYSPAPEAVASAALPSVDSPPPELLLLGETPPSSDPRVQADFKELHWRHTGLADREVKRVAEAVVVEAERHDIDPSLVLAVIQVESGGYNFAVSSVGALGLMQIMPHTGEMLCAQLGVPWRGADMLFDPILNIRLGTAYLKALSDRYGSWDRALAAYNWGPTRIDRRIRRGAALPQVYVQQIMKIYSDDEPGSADG